MRRKARQESEARNRHRALRTRAAGAVAAVVAGGVEPYERRHLLRLLPLTPRDLDDDGIAARRRIVTQLARALRAERNRGRAGHWTYDLNRHIGLAQAYAAERADLQSALRGARSLPLPASMRR